jgi:hypothetical protein
MYRYNTKATILLTDEQTPKQQRTRMKNRSCKRGGNNERRRVKKGS